MSEILAAIGAVWVAVAIPSATHSCIQAKRCGRPAMLGLVIGILLPWFSLLFFTKPQPAKAKVTGLGHYASIMLMIAALLGGISLTMSWVHIKEDIPALGLSYVGPGNALWLAVLLGGVVISLCTSAFAISRRASFSASLAAAITISLFSAVLVGLWKLWGSLGILVPEAREMKETAASAVEFASGGWVAIFAVAIAFVMVTLAPLGFRFELTEIPEPHLPPQDSQGVPPANEMATWQQPSQQQYPQPRQRGAGW